MAILTGVRNVLRQKLRNTVFTCSQWSTALWKQGATPRHTEYRRGHNSNATDTQHINIFQSIKIFFPSRILSYLEAWWPGSPARPGRRCRARGQPRSWRPSQSKHDGFMTRASLGHVAPCPRLVIRMKCWNICWIQHICGRRDSKKMATLSSSWMSDFWVCFVLKCI